MSDDTQRVATADLKLVLRNTEKSARDAQAALEATERLVAGIGPRFDALDARLTGLEGRLNGLERRFAAVEASVDAVARNTHRIEQSIADSNFRIEQMLADISARLP